VSLRLAFFFGGRHLNVTVTVSVVVTGSITVTVCISVTVSVLVSVLRIVLVPVCLIVWPASVSVRPCRVLTMVSPGFARTTRTVFPSRTIVCVPAGIVNTSAVPDWDA
jgi:hypothetical protein